MLTYLWIALGGALGSVARYWVNGLVTDQFIRFGQTFPLGTLVANVSGSFLIGFFATLTDSEGRLLVPPGVRQFVMVGFCGGYTTFSSFSLQTLSLAREGEWLYAGANVVGSVVLCLVAVWVGHLAAAALNRVKGS